MPSFLKLDLREGTSSSVSSKRPLVNRIARRSKVTAAREGAGFTTWRKAASDLSSHLSASISFPRKREDFAAIRAVSPSKYSRSSKTTSKDDCPKTHRYSDADSAAETAGKASKESRSDLQMASRTSQFERLSLLKRSDRSSSAVERYSAAIAAASTDETGACTCFAGNRRTLANSDIMVTELQKL